MGGFFFCDDTGIKEIDIDTFLSLVDAGEISNPEVTASDINDKSSSDCIGKAVLFFQLVWFMIQILARVIYGLAVTLVELDTACMALFTLALIVLWWKKPLCPRRPHFFYTRNTRKSYIKEMSQRGGNLEEWRVGTDSYYSSGKIPTSVLMYIDSIIPGQVS